MSAHEGKESAAELGGSPSRADYSSPKGKKHANASDEDEAKAVHQVATVAQSSIRRLQMVVKEKEEAILSLQNAVSAAYQAALQEQAHNQAQLEALHAVLSVHGEHSIEHMHHSLQTLARKKPKKDDNGLTGTLIRSMARLIDDQLQDLTAQHEQEIKALERNMDMYKKQSQELEANLEEERWQHQAHVSQIEEEMQTQRPKEEHIRRLEAEKFQSQLRSKDVKLKEAREEYKLLELRLMEAQQKNLTRKEAGDISIAEYAKARSQANQLQVQVANLSQQLRHAKETTSQRNLTDVINSQEVKSLREEVAREREIGHKMAVKLAKYRRKERERELQIPQLLVTSPTQDSDQFKDRDEVLTILTHTHAHDWDGHCDDNCGNLPADIGKKELKESHEILGRKVHALQKKLLQCRQELKESGETQLHNERIIQQLKDAAARKRCLADKKRKAAGVKEHGPSADCVKIKELLESLDQVESDNTRLQSSIMVDQQTTIKRLEKEVMKLKQMCWELGKDSADCDLHGFSLPEMDTAITAHESATIQLKFERDQALWKLGQLEQRFNILFGAQLQDHSHKKHTCDYFIPDATPPHAFAGRKLLVAEPNALCLMRDSVNKGLKTGTVSREKELEGLVESLLRVVEKQRVEIEHLKQACHNTIQHMEQNRSLRSKVEELQCQLGKEKCCQPSHSPHEIIADLKKDLERTTQANIGLIHALKETEESYIFLQQKLHETTKEKPTLLSPLKACSSNEHNEAKSGKLPSKMELQAQEIARLQNELAAKLHSISDLKTQLEIQENELSFVHGQLTIKEAADSAQARGLEQPFVANKDTQNKQHFSDTMGHSLDDKLRLDLAFVQAENDRLKAELEAFDPAYFEDLEDLKSEYQQLSTVWSQSPTYSALSFVALHLIT